MARRSCCFHISILTHKRHCHCTGIFSFKPRHTDCSEDQSLFRHSPHLCTKRMWIVPEGCWKERQAWISRGAGRQTQRRISKHGFYIFTLSISLSLSPSLSLPSLSHFPSLSFSYGVFRLFTRNPGAEKGSGAGGRPRPAGRADAQKVQGQLAL